MDALKEIVFIALMLVIAFTLATYLVGLYWRRHNRKNTKISEAYRKAVEKHKLELEDSHDTEFSARNGYAPTGKDADRSQAFSDASRSDGMEISAASAILWGSDFAPDPDPSPSNHSSYEGAGHGGSFGGGGASGSWDSGSSYDSGGSDSSSSWSD